MPHILLLHQFMTAWILFKKKMLPEISCFQKNGERERKRERKKKSKSAWNCPPTLQQLPKHQAKKTKRSFSPQNIHNFNNNNRKASFFLPLSFVFKKGLPISVFIIQLQFFLLALRVPWPGWLWPFTFFFPSVFRSCTNTSFYVTSENYPLLLKMDPAKIVAT